MFVLGESLLSICMTRKFKAIIGRAELVSFPELGLDAVHAKVDTGAHRSSIDVSYVEEKDGVLHYTLFHEGDPNYSGDVLTTDSYRSVTIYNSFGEGQDRYEVKIWISLGKKKVKTGFTLADRSKKIYPVLLGRKLLQERFMVDVSEGVPHPDDKES